MRKKKSDKAKKIREQATEDVEENRKTKEALIRQEINGQLREYEEAEEEEEERRSRKRKMMMRR